jgi:hypothetical protein
MSFESSPLATILQVWNLQPPFREEVEEAVRVMKSYKSLTIAFHGKRPRRVGSPDPNADRLWLMHQEGRKESQDTEAH